MKSIPKLFLVLFFTIIATKQTTAQNVTPAHTDSLNTIITQYYELNVQIFQANSTKEQIDKLFGIFTEDFTYVHPKYGGTYTREDLYNGYTRNQKNGGYDGSVTNIKILQKITGLNAVVVKKSFMEKEGDSVKTGEAQMTLFEFRKGKISRIFEYW